MSRFLTVDVKFVDEDRTINLNLPYDWSKNDIVNLLGELVEQNNMKMFFGQVEPTPRHLGQLDPQDYEFEDKEPGTPPQPKQKSAPTPQVPPPEKGTGSRATSAVARSGPLQPAHHDREQWPDHIKKLVVPPAWNNVHYNHNPDAALQVTGHDIKGRKQYLYHPDFAASQQEAKFGRVKDLESQADHIIKQNDIMRQHHDPIVREHADAMSLVAKMGLRPGGDDDPNAAVKAYGATTLLGKHLVQGQRLGTRLRFTGKKGVNLDLPVEDPHTAKMLFNRAAKAGPGGELFPNVNARSLLNHIHQFGGFKSKDFRTLHASRTAQEAMKGMAPPTNEKEYNKATRLVAKHVASKLGNTATVALQSYIPPVLFGDWRHKAGM